MHHIVESNSTALKEHGKESNSTALKEHGKGVITCSSIDNLLGTMKALSSIAQSPHIMDLSVNLLPVGESQHFFHETLQVPVHNP